MQTSTLYRSDPWRYSIAISAVVAIMACVPALRPWLGNNVPPALLAASILVGAWYGGLAIGLLSTALNALAAAYFLLPPLNSFRIADRGDWLDLGALAAQGVILSWLFESRRRARVARASAVAEAQRARADVQARSYALAQATANLKHATRGCIDELQKPLVRLASQAEWLTERFRDSEDAELAERVASVETSVGRMSAFTEGLICYSRLAAALPRSKRIASQALVERALERFEYELQDAGADVTIEGPLPFIEADEPQMLRVFENLIDNAIKFRNGEPLRIRIACDQRQSQYIFSVADNGIGIVPAHWDEVFAIGRRLNGDEHPGAGMGLAIAKRILENHGGQIWITSQPGQGATVRFAIPRQSN